MFQFPKQLAYLCMSSKKNLNLSLGRTRKNYSKEIIHIGSVGIYKSLCFPLWILTPVNSLKNNIQMDQKGQFLFTNWFGNALTSTALPNNYQFKMCRGDRYIHACI